MTDDLFDQEERIEDGQYIGVAKIPRDQQFGFKITPLPGRLLDLATIGKSWTALAAFHAALGRDMDPKRKWGTYITDVELEADGSLRVDVAMLPKEVEDK